MKVIQKDLLCRLKYLVTSDFCIYVEGDSVNDIQHVLAK